MSKFNSLFRVPPNASGQGGGRISSLSLALMASSLILLVALQYFWLKNSYDKAHTDLRKDTNEIFRATLTALRDSSVLRSIERAPAEDSVPGSKNWYTYTERRDSAGRTIEAFNTDVKIIVSSHDASSDSVREIIRPIVKQMHEQKLRRGGTFTFRMRSDTLSSDSLLQQFRAELIKAGIDETVVVGVETRTELPMKIDDGNVLLRRRPPIDTVVPAAGHLRSEWVPYDPFHQYAANISSFRSMLLREIAPQILFSVFLTLLTATAFFIMYRSLRAQQRLVEMKNDFISNITHELKTPVTTVSVAIEALRDFNGLQNPQTTREYLDIAQSELNRLTLLTDKILKSAIFENRGIGFEPEPVDLSKTVEQILKSMKLIFDKQKAKVTFEQRGDSFTIIGGSVHLTNVIYNLLDNALKYSAGEPQISISLQEDSSEVVLKVEDRGIGIPLEYKKKIFEKFFRVPTGDVHNVKGYGLGLSYVQAVVKSHRGLIQVSSEPGEGSVFTIFLPKQVITS